jgi:hypothetical protein
MPGDVIVINDQFLLIVQCSGPSIEGNSYYEFTVLEHNNVIKTKFWMNLQLRYFRTRGKRRHSK